MSSVKSTNSKMSYKTNPIAEDSWEDSWEDGPIATVSGSEPIATVSGSEPVVSKKTKKITKIPAVKEEVVEEDWTAPQSVSEPKFEEPKSTVFVKKSKFDEMGINDSLLTAVYSAGFEKPKVHQKTTIPTAINCFNEATAEGKTPPHMLVCAPTNSGKTLSYVLSALNTVDPTVKKTQVLIVCGNRELAGEIYERVCNIVAADAEQPKDIAGSGRKHTNPLNNILSVALHRGTHSNDVDGGERNHAQKYFTSATNLEDLGNEQVVIGTVRRILDLIQNTVYVGTEHKDMFMALAKKNGIKIPRGAPTNNFCMVHIDTTFIQEFVMDEADELMNTGGNGHMTEYVYEILDSLPSYTRYIMYSATMSQNIRLFGDEIGAIYLEFEATEKTNSIINHSYVVTGDDEGKVDCMIEIIKRMPNIGSIIIFTSAINVLRTLVGELEHAKFPVVSIHGRMTQTKRDEAISLFKTGKVRIIVATDIIGRGVDIPLVDLVINFDLPEDDHRIYKHRSGRAGRAGKIGQSISLIASSNSAIPLVVTKIAKAMTITISALTNDMLTPV